MTPTPDPLPLSAEEEQVADQLAQALPALVGAWDEGKTDNVELAHLLVRLVSRSLDAARASAGLDVERLRALSDAASPGPYIFNGYPFTLGGADAEFAVAATNYVRAALSEPKP